MQCVKNRLRRVSGAGLCMLFSALGAVPLGAQPSANGASVGGTVVDQAGKAILGAAVTVKNEATGGSQMLATDTEGHFSVSGLPAGSYTIVVSAPGFALTTRSGGLVTAGATLDMPITMSVETVATSITVSESISLAASTAICFRDRKSTRLNSSH